MGKQLYEWCLILIIYKQKAFRIMEGFRRLIFNTTYTSILIYEFLLVTHLLRLLQARLQLFLC